MYAGKLAVDDASAVPPSSLVQQGSCSWQMLFTTCVFRTAKKERVGCFSGRFGEQRLRPRCPPRPSPRCSVECSKCGNTDFRPSQPSLVDSRGYGCVYARTTNDNGQLHNEVGIGIRTPPILQPNATIQPVTRTSLLALDHHVHAQSIHHLPRLPPHRRHSYCCSLRPSFLPFEPPPLPVSGSSRSASPQPMKPPFGNSHSTPSSAMSTKLSPSSHIHVLGSARRSPESLSRTDNGRILGALRTRSRSSFGLLKSTFYPSFLFSTFHSPTCFGSRHCSSLWTWPRPSHSSSARSTRLAAKLFNGWCSLVGGVVATTLPHFECIVVVFAVPITVNHILRRTRKIDRLLDLVVPAILDIGTQGILLVLPSRHSAIVSRVAHKASCLPSCLPPCLPPCPQPSQSPFTLLDVPTADFTRVPVLLLALDSTEGILFLARKLSRYSRKTLPRRLSQVSSPLTSPAGSSPSPLRNLVPSPQDTRM
ncbi:hypothetical protein C8F01DRAFT_160438 [Mycena amicta]|nr:hypothetical protein C8F01DRAFT_160438 [Mycena amicta]